MSRKNCKTLYINIYYNKYHNFLLSFLTSLIIPPPRHISSIYKTQACPGVTDLHDHI